MNGKGATCQCLNKYLHGSFLPAGLIFDISLLSRTDINNWHRFVFLSNARLNFLAVHLLEDICNLEVGSGEEDLRIKLVSKDDLLVVDLLPARGDLKVVLQQ